MAKGVVTLRPVVTARPLMRTVLAKATRGQTLLYCTPFLAWTGRGQVSMPHVMPEPFSCPQACSAS